MLSYHVGRPIVYKYLTEKAVKWSEQVERHKDHLINYIIIFLRITTPFLPNWFINITSPVINVPLKSLLLGDLPGRGPSVIRGDQGRDHTVPADHGGGGGLLELRHCPHDLGCPLHLACHLPEETKEEV
ncbi:unnamed protein product [Staurois parvus]|uniref:Uncharacterized protein n=1 Tax=Staurois parvus TaxID=386267 RepID=A0ABN9B640_9NEOB|nr:unnamed protein product [Staurois parvus]